MASLISGFAASAPLAAQSGTVSVAQEKLLPGAITIPTRIEPGARRILAAAACGTSRICTPAWDLRLTGLRLDDSVTSPSGSIAARFTIENRGRLASEASEVRLCVASGDQCIGEPAEVPLPPLASGEKLEVSQPVASYGGKDVAPPYSLLVRVDPDRATAESNRANNDATIRIAIDTAAVVIETFDVPAALSEGAVQVPVTFVVRNTSRAAVSAILQLQLGGRCNSNSGWWGDIATRVKVPSLLPNQVWSSTVTVRHPMALRPGDSCNVTAELVSAGRAPLSEGRSALWRPYVIKSTPR